MSNKHLEKKKKKKKKKTRLTPLGKLPYVYFALKEDPIKVQKCHFKEFTSCLTPVLDLWINFSGHEKLLKIVTLSRTSALQSKLITAFRV